MIWVSYKKLHESVADPQYQHDGDACFDLAASEALTVYPNDTPVKMRTGLIFEIPTGYEMQIRLRSGIASQGHIVIPNAPGTVDSGYRGEVMVLLLNLRDTPYIINEGDRIAQAKIALCPQVLLKKTAKIHHTARGNSGFGSTGI